MAYGAKPYDNSDMLSRTEFSFYQVPLGANYGLSTNAFFYLESLKVDKDKQLRDDYAFNKYLHPDGDDKSRRVQLGHLENLVVSLLMSEGNFKWVTDSKLERVDVRHDGTKLFDPWPLVKIPSLLTRGTL